MSDDLASNLLDKKVGSWDVVSKIVKPGGSGGGFSSGYVVQRHGQQAYLKALNVQYAFKSTGVSGTIMDNVKRLTDDFIHERDLLSYCNAQEMDRIVVALDSGEYTEAGSPFPVPYLIFELCKGGDIRTDPKMADHGVSWRLKIFQGACLGVAQLHRHDIAHQDIKPANILVFDADHTKLADLGRGTRNTPGSRFGGPGDHGDSSYLPFELFYGHSDPDWEVRRKATDIFMLGGVLVYLVANVNIVGLVLSKMPAEYHYMRWKGGFSAALPAIQHAFSQASDEIVWHVRADMRAELREMILWLCNPDPAQRGHPRSVAQRYGKYSLERIISIVDRLSKLAQRPVP